MCGRYITGEGIYELVIDELGIGETVFPYFPEGDINPGSIVPVIAEGGYGLEFHEAFWGFPGKDSSLVINARSESVLARPMFSASFYSRRCLVPSAGFYEWDREKNKVLFRYPDCGIMYLAAIWNLIDDIQRFVILTTDANDSMRPVHDRMPLLIHREDAKLWLRDTDKAIELMAKEMPQLMLSREAEQLSFL